MRIVATLLFLALIGAQASAAQEAPDTAQSRTTALFDIRDLYLLAGFAGGTVLAFPLDDELADRLQDPEAQANKLFQRAATGLNVTARPGSLIIGGSLYAVGRLAGSRRVADLGLHGVEALVVTEALTRLIKGLAGRGRPLLDRNDPANFEFARGFSNRDYQSFPSGHTSSAFAAAAVVTAETERWWPRWKPVIGTLMFGGASLAGLTRMYNNKHWASDVMAGAALGSFAGWKVVRFHHSHPNNTLDRLLLGMTVIPQPDGGMALVWSLPAAPARAGD